MNVVQASKKITSQDCKR